MDEEVRRLRQSTDAELIEIIRTAFFAGEIDIDAAWFAVIWLETTKAKIH